MAPFDIQVNGMPAVATLTEDASHSPVQVNGPLQFTADAFYLDASVQGDLTVAGGVLHIADNDVFGLHLVHGSPVAAVALDRNVAAGPVELPCASLVLQDTCAHGWEARHDERPANDGSAWTVTSASLQVCTQPDSGSCVTLAPLPVTPGDPDFSLVARDSAEEWRGPWLSRIATSGRFTTVYLDGTSGSSLTGMVATSALREVTPFPGFDPEDDLDCEEPEPTPERVPSRRCVEASGVWDLPEATIAAGTLLYASPGLGPWATVAPGAQLDVRMMPGTDWAEVQLDGVEGFTSAEVHLRPLASPTPLSFDPAGYSLLSGWIPVGAIQAPASLPACATN
jgi:hypothetical protein